MSGRSSQITLYILCVCAVSMGVHVCKIGNHLPEKGHLPCFGTPVLQFVVKVQLCVWIRLCLCGSKMLQKELMSHIT